METKKEDDCRGFMEADNSWMGGEASLKHKRNLDQKANTGCEEDTTEYTIFGCVAWEEQ